MLHVFLSDDALSNKQSVDSTDKNMTGAFDMKKLNHENLSYSNSRRKDSESDTEGLPLVVPFESKIEQ